MEIAEQLAAKQKELLDAGNAQRRAEYTSFPTNALLWAALGPGWTASLARSAGFPSGGDDPGEVLDRIAERGLTVKSAASAELQLDTATGKASLAQPEDLYLAGEQSLREIIETTTGASDRDWTIRQCITRIAQGLRGAQNQGVTLPNRIAKWVELAERIDSYSLAKDYLLERVNEQLKQGNEPAAIEWVESAFPLEKALDGQIALGVRLAGLLVQLHQRKAGNERYLESFLERASQIEAFRQLLDGPDHKWALHYTGSGGVGKTMLVRYLESRGAPAAGASTARVDFDYLNPEYPTTKPALLLVEFAGDLRLADKTGLATPHFQSFFDKAQTLHERLAGQPEPGMAPHVDDPEFQSLLGMFASAVRLLPGRAILILDTCEELAKMRPDGSPQAGVEVTFTILERLHEQVPSLRVVFCGRRPLASAGDGWTCRKTTDVSLPARPYLRLHEILSFSRQEARDYLEHKAQCPVSFIEPILPHCVERDYTPLFSTATTPGGTLRYQRYNPFELSLYATWVRKEPDLTPDEVASTGLDQYVRTRIVGRIQNRELAALLPAIAWVGTVDESAMAHLAALPEGSDRVLELSAEMERQEWVEGAPGRRFLVSPGMRRRLLDYYAANNPAAYNEGRSAAATYLEQLLPAIPVRGMLVLHLEAALEALQPEPERAARWWHAIEERILEESAWDWVLAPTLRLLADEHWPDSVLKGKHIRASIAATRAAAQIHTGDLAGAQETSHRMEADAPRHPDEREGRHLKLIAQALRGEIGTYGPDDVTEETSAALLTGTEWALENPPATKATQTIQRWLGAIRQAGLSLEQQAYTCMLTGRAFAEESDHAIPRSYFQAACGMASFFEHAVNNRRWRFWLAPADLASRLRLECLRWAWPVDASPGQLEWWLEAPAQIADADTDRLASAILSIQAALRTPFLKLDNSREAINGSRNVFLSDRGSLSIHRHFDPYFTVALEELAYAGHVDDVMEMLVQQTSNAEAVSEILATYAADRQKTRIITRFRLGDEGYSPGESLLYSPDLDHQFLVSAHKSLSGSPASFKVHDSVSPEGAHLEWATAIAPDRTSAEPLLDWARKTLGSFSAESVTFADISCRLDLVEANQLAAQFDQRPVVAPFEPPRETREPLSPEAAFIVNLRMWSLMVAPEPAPALADRIGIRRAATIALELGELLALRLPQRSLRMLRFARKGFHESGDHMRETISCACLALALARAGRKNEVHEPVERLTVLFAEPRNDLIGPESWSYISKAVTSPSAYPGLEVRSTWTRPWLLRIALCLALSRDGGSAGKFSDNVLEVWRRVTRDLPPESLVGVSHADSPPAPARPNAIAPVPFMAPIPELPAALTIECLDKVTRPQAGTRMRISRSGKVLAEIATPAPTAPYREAWRLLAATPADLDSLWCVVDSGSAWGAWECMLDPTGRRMFPRRTNDQNKPIKLVSSARRSFHTLTMNSAGTDLGGSSFSRYGDWSYSTNPGRVNMIPAGQAILHVVADVVDTTGGARLSFQARETGLRGEVIRAEDLSKLLPDFGLFILQLPVGYNDGRRDEVCREKAALLRAFAAQLRLVSRQIVIALPGLRPPEGLVLLQSIAKGVSAKDPSSSILKELTDARAKLFQTLPPDETEAGFDVCYFG